MDLAVIKTGGKQYLVSPGNKIKVEKIDGKEDKEINFADILLVVKGKKIEIGAPLVKDAKVIGRIIKQGRGKKVIIFKYKPKKRYKKKQGHRQPYTEIEITDIILGKKAISPKPKPKKSTTKKSAPKTQTKKKPTQKPIKKKVATKK